MYTRLVDPQRLLEAMLDVYQVCIENTESIEDDEMLGPDLAYLLGAMMKNTYCEWHDTRYIVRLITAALPRTHLVWESLRIEDD